MGIKAEFHGISMVPSEVVEAHRASSLARGLKEHNDFKGSGPTLVVVGSGPSAEMEIDEIRALSKTVDIWGFNGAAGWLIRQGIEAVLFSLCNGSAEQWGDIEHYTRGVKKAILSWTCAPELYDSLLGKGAQVLLARIASELLVSGSTCAVGAPAVALGMDYKHVTFFGCEGSFSRKCTHVDRNDRINEVMIVQCNDEEFMTNPQMILQTTELSTLMREFPHVFRNRSGGFLQAMIESKGEWTLERARPEMWKSFRPKEQLQAELQL